MCISVTPFDIGAPFRAPFSAESSRGRGKTLRALPVLPRRIGSVFKPVLFSVIIRKRVLSAEKAVQIFDEQGNMHIYATMEP